MHPDMSGDCPVAAAPAFVALMRELSASIESLPQAADCVVDALLALFELCDGGIDIRLVDLEGLTTPPAGKLRVYLEPSQFLLDLVPALRAGDWNRAARDIQCHLNSLSSTIPAKELRHSDGVSRGLHQ